jgi:hypothetical protein
MSKTLVFLLCPPPPISTTLPPAAVVTLASLLPVSSQKVTPPPPYGLTSPAPRILSSPFLFPIETAAINGRRPSFRWTAASQLIRPYKRESHLAHFPCNHLPYSVPPPCASKCHTSNEFCHRCLAPSLPHSGTAPSVEALSKVLHRLLRLLPNSRQAFTQPALTPVVHHGPVDRRPPVVHRTREPSPPWDLQNKNNSISS